MDMSLRLLSAKSPVCVCVFAEIGLFHSIGRADFKSIVVKFINISVLSGTFIKILQLALRLSSCTNACWYGYDVNAIRINF